MLFYDMRRKLTAIAGQTIANVQQLVRAPKEDPSAIVDEPEQLTLDRQWEQLESHMVQGMARTQAVFEMQDTATLHLDAARYSLDRIAIELVDVMPSITEVAPIDVALSDDAAPGSVIAPAKPVETDEQVSAHSGTKAA